MELVCCSCFCVQSLFVTIASGFTCLRMLKPFLASQPYVNDYSCRFYCWHVSGLGTIVVKTAKGFAQAMSNLNVLS